MRAVRRAVQRDLVPARGHLARQHRRGLHLLADHEEGGLETRPRRARRARRASRPGPGPSSNVSATRSSSSRSSAGNSRQRASVSRCWPKLGNQPCAGRGALLARLQEAVAERALLLGRRIERGDVGQLVQAAEAEELLEQVARAVEDGAELGAAGLLDQPALEQRADRRLRRDAADARDLGPRHRLEVGDDREALRLRLRERRRARPREQPARRALGDRVGGEREAARDLAQHDAAPALGVVLAQPRERLDDLALADLARLGHLGGRQRVGGQEEQRLDDARELVHCAITVIGPKFSSCCQAASPDL